MIKIAVYGNDKYSLKMKELLETDYSSLLMSNGGEAVEVPFLVSDKDMSDTISIDEFALKYKAGDLAAIVIPKEYFMQYNAIIQKLIMKEINVNDIYNGCRLSGDTTILITPMLEDSYLSYLEYHVADHCNLNCKYCTHFSPLVKDKIFTDYESWKKDITKLKEYIDDIGIIRILGGEPLLNPELPKFIEYTRALYPAAIIYVVTNGLLLSSISDELIETMRNNIAFFHISYYPPLENKLEEVKMNLTKMNIAYQISPLIRGFNKTQLVNDNNDEDFFYKCFQATCNCIHDGMIAPCYSPFTTKYFNNAFDTKLPENEGIDLYNEENTTSEIKLKLLYPMERCRFCTNGDVYPWEIVGKNSSLSDWI